MRSTDASRFSGAVKLSGLVGNDTLQGAKGGDKLLGGAGHDLLLGNTGRDRLVGGSANDRLLGGKGADLLIGGNGRDTLRGGKGADRFQFNRFSEGVDIIQDFQRGTDSIEISGTGFGAGLRSGQLRAAQFVKGSATTSQHRFIFTSQGNLLFDRDGAGRGRATLIAQLNGSNLGAADILIR